MLNSKLDSLGLIAIWAITFGLQACAKTKFGQDLAKSFESSSLPSLDQSGEAQNREALVEKKSVKLQPIQKKKTALKINRKREQPIAPFNPQPYRVTIKLSGADPSAPAEEVTKALRFAGVRFHVEKIERIESNKLLKTMPIRTRTRP